MKNMSGVMQDAEHHEDTRAREEYFESRGEPSADCVADRIEKRESA